MNDSGKSTAEGTFWGETGDRPGQTLINLHLLEKLGMSHLSPAFVHAPRRRTYRILAQLLPNGGSAPSAPGFRRFRNHSSFYSTLSTAFGKIILDGVDVVQMPVC